MQGQRGKMISVPESLEVDGPSSSRGAALDQQLLWNDIRSPLETHFSSFMLPADENNNPFLSSISHEQQNWGLDEASSSSGPRIEDQRFGPSSTALSLDNSFTNPTYVQPSGSVPIPPDTSSIGEYIGSSRENPHKSSGFNTNQRFPNPSGRDEYVSEESEVRLGGSLDGLRLPCKRKSFEGHITQSSFTENPDFLATPPCFDINGGQPMSQTVSEPVGQSLRLNMARGAAARNLPGTESASTSSRRNVRLRLRLNSSSNQNDLIRPSSLSSPTVAPAPESSTRLVMRHRSLELPPPLGLSSSVPQGLHPLLQTPVMVPGSSRSPILLPDEASSSVVNSGNMMQQQQSIPSLNISSSRGLMGASSSGFPGNVDSAPLGSSSSAAVLQRHPHHRRPRRWYEYVHRQLMSSIGSNSGEGQSSQTSNSSGQQQSLSRSALRMERQGDNSAIGTPYPVRSLAAGSEGRRRFASEVLRVLELMRRGEGRFQDVMILDPSMFSGMADMYDRHRDMRLDVHNMSYEELLALEERIGNVCTGLNEETILARMKQWKLSDIANTQMESEPCCICQEDYKDGEDLGTLECGHDFHRDCIKQWLMQKNLCPICKTAGLTT